MKKKSQYETPEQFKSQEESEKGQRESKKGQACMEKSGARRKQRSDCARQGILGQWGTVEDVRMREGGKSCEFQRGLFSGVEKGSIGVPRSRAPDGRLGRL